MYHNPPDILADTLDEAKGIEDVYLVIEGDYGGVYSLIAPTSIVKCNQATLSELVFDIEAYGGGSIEAAREGGYITYFSKLKVGDRLGWETEYTEVTEGISLSKYAEYLRPYVESVLSGNKIYAEKNKTILFKNRTRDSAR